MNQHTSEKECATCLGLRYLRVHPDGKMPCPDCTHVCPTAKPLPCKTCGGSKMMKYEGCHCDPECIATCTDCIAWYKKPIEYQKIRSTSTHALDEIGSKLLFNVRAAAASDLEYMVIQAMTEVWEWHSKSLASERATATEVGAKRALFNLIKNRGMGFYPHSPEMQKGQDNAIETCISLVKNALKGIDRNAKPFNDNEVNMAVAAELKAPELMDEINKLL